MVSFTHILPSLTLRGLTFSSMFDGLESKSSALSLRLLCGRSPSTSFGASTWLSKSESSSSAPSAAVFCTSSHLCFFLAQSNAPTDSSPSSRSASSSSPHHKTPTPPSPASSPTSSPKQPSNSLSSPPASPPSSPSSSPSTQATSSTVSAHQGPVCAPESAPNPKIHTTCSARSKGQTMTERSCH